MLVSLSLSPASTAAMNDKRWAFLVRFPPVMFYRAHVKYLLVLERDETTDVYTLVTCTSLG